MKRTFFDTLFVCHKLPHRSFFYKGTQFPICARCTGIFIGYILATLYFLLGFIFDFTYPNFLFSATFIIPTIIDGTIQYFTSYESGNYRRLLTGIFAGFGIIFIFGYIASMAFSHGRWLIEQLK